MLSAIFDFIGFKPKKQDLPVYVFIFLSLVFVALGVTLINNHTRDILNAVTHFLFNEEEDTEEKDDKASETTASLPSPFQPPKKKEQGQNTPSESAKRINAKVNDWRSLGKALESWDMQNKTMVNNLQNLPVNKIAQTTVTNSDDNAASWADLNSLFTALEDVKEVRLAEQADESKTAQSTVPDKTVTPDTWKELSHSLRQLEAQRSKALKTLQAR